MDNHVYSGEDWGRLLIFETIVAGFIRADLNEYPLLIFTGSDGNSLQRCIAATAPFVPGSRPSSIYSVSSLGCAVEEVNSNESAVLLLTNMLRHNGRQFLDALRQGTVKGAYATFPGSYGQTRSLSLACPKIVMSHTVPPALAGAADEIPVSPAATPVGYFLKNEREAHASTLYPKVRQFAMDSQERFLSLIEDKARGTPPWQNHHILKRSFAALIDSYDPAIGAVTSIEKCIKFQEERLALSDPPTMPDLQVLSGVAEAVEMDIDGDAGGGWHSSKGLLKYLNSLHGLEHLTAERMWRVIRDSGILVKKRKLRAAVDTQDVGKTVQHWCASFDVEKLEVILSKYKGESNNERHETGMPLGESGIT